MWIATGWGCLYSSLHWWSELGTLRDDRGRTVDTESLGHRHHCR
ncbi:hypothetical protein [Streptomyces sp. NPDC088707]